MKKKIALLLAAVMTISAPLTAFAKDPGYYTNNGNTSGRTKILNVPAGTLKPTADLYGATTPIQSLNSNASVVSDQGVDYIMGGSDLAIPMGKSTQTSIYNRGALMNGDVIGVNLNNSHFWYAQDMTNSNYININGRNSTFLVNGNSFDQFTNLVNPYTGYIPTNNPNRYTTWVATNNNVRVYNQLQKVMQYDAKAVSLPDTFKYYDLNGNRLTVGVDILDPIVYPVGGIDFYAGYYLNVANNDSTKGATGTVEIIVKVGGQDAPTTAINVVGGGTRSVVLGYTPNYTPATISVTKDDIATVAKNTLLGLAPGSNNAATNVGNLITNATSVAAVGSITIGNIEGAIIAADASLAETAPGVYPTVAAGIAKTAVTAAINAGVVSPTSAAAANAATASANALASALNVATVTAAINAAVTASETTNPLTATTAAAIRAAITANEVADAVAGDITINGAFGLAGTRAATIAAIEALDADGDITTPIATAVVDAYEAAYAAAALAGARTVVTNAAIAAIPTASQAIQNAVSANLIVNATGLVAQGVIEAAIIAAAPLTAATANSIATAVHAAMIAKLAETTTNPNTPATGTLSVPLAYKTMNSSNTSVVINSSGARYSGIESDSEDLTAGITASGTNLSISVTNATREQTALGAVTVSETAPGVMRTGYFALDISNGFKFTEQVLGMTSADSTWATATFMGYSVDMKTAYFSLNVTNSSTGLARSITISGLQVSRDSDYYNYNTETASITVRNLVTETITYLAPNRVTNTTSTFRVTGDTRITTQTITAATFAAYGLYFGFDNTTDKATAAYAGRKNVVTPMLKLAENVSNSWWTNRTTKFTLTDKDGTPLDLVKIAKVTVGSFDKVTYLGNTWTFSEDAQVGYNAYWSFYRGSLELKDMSKTANYNNASMKIQFVINTAANFEGDVYVSLNGTGIYVDDYQEVAPVKIATIKAPVKIETSSTEVSIGYQSYKVADVKITEDAKGVLKAGTVFALELDEFANATNNNTTDVAFNPITDKDVAMGEKTTLTFNKITLGGNKLSFNISKPSTKDDYPGIFTVSNLYAKINKSVPYGSYDLIAGGSAIAETYSNAADLEKTAFFPIKGVISEGYIKVATAGSTKSVAKNVVVTPGSTKAIVDGKEASAMAQAPFINAEGRIMIPFRATALLFDIPETDIIWDPTVGTATIIIGEKMVTFTNNSSVMQINGVPVAMVDENGIATKAVITEDTNRMFIPLRQLGIAYGINVVWDGTNAYFNPTAEQAKAAQ